MDIYIRRVAAAVVALHQGRFTNPGCIHMLHKSFEAFATNELPHDDHVVTEAAGNASSAVAALESSLDRVLVVQLEAGAHDHARKDQD